MNISKLSLKLTLSTLMIVLMACKKKENPKDINGIMAGISVASNVVYKKVDSTELKLDVYYPATKLGEEPWDQLSADNKPTLIYFHGGGWIEGDRTSRFLGLLPYLAKGWCVVNVDYRLLQETHLLESINDCIDAINWVDQNSSTYKFDPDQIYLSGESAGGHLALLAGMIHAAKISDAKIISRKSKIKGIINWYGITDMQEAIKFWNEPSYTQMIVEKWPGDIEQYYEICSPMNHISTHTPPIISIHGDADVNVPFSQATSFHQQLTAENVPNKLIQIKAKKHGDFSASELATIFDQIWVFIDP